MEDLEAIFFVVILIIVAGFGYAIGQATERKILVNKLCYQQQYDFCVIKEYKLKE